ncbi:S24 family peptidase [Malaciobacter mytili]|uniref:S24 family peptidase n=1 Tax=Malaciobacter mytili TaxID=603050 RepID=UPI003BAFB64C
MEPDIKDGSLLFIDKSKTDINDRGIYLVNTNDGLYIKCVEVKDSGAILISLNQSYSNIETKIKDINIIGRVCGVLTRL